jgi:hypothetical protein
MSPTPPHLAAGGLGHPLMCTTTIEICKVESKRRLLLSANRSSYRKQQRLRIVLRWTRDSYVIWVWRGGACRGRCCPRLACRSTAEVDRLFTAAVTAACLRDPDFEPSLFLRCTSSPTSTDVAPHPDRCRHRPSGGPSCWHSTAHGLEPFQPLAISPSVGRSMPDFRQTVKLLHWRPSGRAGQEIFESRPVHGRQTFLHSRIDASRQLLIECIFHVIFSASRVTFFNYAYFCFVVKFINLFNLFFLIYRVHELQMKILCSLTF